jgi:AcrR family transcriptional regulator
MDKSKAAPSSKDDKFWQVLDAILALEMSHGHLRWTVADLSRKSRVSRTLIYYYFGKSKSKMLDLAMKVIGEEYFGLSEERHQMWLEGRTIDSLLLTRQMAQKAPHVAEFYLRWRRTSSPIQKELLALEKRYINKLIKHRPAMPEARAQALFGFFWGVCASPALEDSEVRELAELVISHYLK